MDKLTNKPRTELVISKASNSGDYNTNCTYQHNLAVTCGECSEDMIVQALQRAKQQEKVL